MRMTRIFTAGILLALCGLLFWQCKDDNEKKSGFIVESMAFSEEEITLREGEFDDLYDYLIVEPEGIVDTLTIDFESSNKEVASVTGSGMVLASSDGRCTVTASAYGKTAEIDVRVTPLPITDFDVPSGTLQAAVNVPMALDITVTPAQASPKRLNVSVQPESASLKFENKTWKFTASEAGVYTVSVENDEIVKTITVEAKVKPVESVALNKASVAIPINGTVVLTATILPEDATYKTVTWSSGDNSIVTVDENGVCRGLKIGKTVVTATAEGGYKATCSVRVLEQDPSTLPLFSVEADKWVLFAPGNLQYTTTGTHSCADGTTKTGTWRFAQHQYDYIGAGNSNISSTYTGWVDLFGWGVTGYGAHPYTTSTSATYGNTADKYSDWGTYNAIQNGTDIDEPGAWRVPTHSDFHYILNVRANHANLKGVAKVNGVNGLVLLPDNWSFPAEVSFTPGVASQDGAAYYSTVNNYSEAQWKQLEDYGAVFLPAAGYRMETSLYKQNEDGRYWTIGSYNYYGTTRIVRLFFSSNAVECMRNYDGTSLRYMGYSVRLVQDF
ncbi:MAG: hypothetical protein E7076_00385 [Bacteroidales bacterium]|nr:hypothetical protein [Bacteroidales bacterium]